MKEALPNIDVTLFTPTISIFTGVQNDLLEVDVNMLLKIAEDILCQPFVIFKGTVNLCVNSVLIPT